MKLIPEYDNESLETLCHSVQVDEDTHRNIAIDEQNLAWMFVDPAYKQSECCEKLFAWALRLLGDQAWLILQSSEQGCQELINAYNIMMVESYHSEDADQQAISLLLARTQ